MKNSILKCILIISSISITSCATLFSDSYDEVSFKSEPSGATVYLNGEVIGKTPFKYSIERNTFNSSQILIRKKGYKPQRFTLLRSLNPVSLFNTIFLLSYATDASSGKLIEYSPKSYFLELESKGAALIQDTTRQYVIFNAANIKRDIVKGEGEYLSAYSQLVHKHPSEVMKRLQGNLDILLSKVDAVDFYRHLRALWL